MTKTTEAQPITQDDNTLLLDTPVKRGNTEIDQVTLRKPSSGELRGLNLSELLQLDVNSLIKLLPRITSPALNEYEASKLDPADLVAIGTKVISFLLQKWTKTDASLAA